MANEVNITVTAEDQASAKLDTVQSKAGKLGSMLGTALKAGAIAAGVALAAAGTSGIKMGMDFGKGMAEVKTLLPDLSEKGFNKLKGDVLDLSKEMGIATSEVVPALYQAISAGVPPENVIDFLRTGAKTSIGGVTDLQTAVDGLTTVVNAFGMSADDTGHVADVMFTAVKLGKTTMGELSQSMFQAAPLAASLGLGIEDVAAATATLTKSGTPTSVAMTQIRQAMVAMSKPNKDMNDLLAKTGYESGEALLKSEGFAGALGILSDAAGGNKEAMGKAFGSVEALQAVLGLTGENAETAAADLAAMNDATGAADEAFKTMSDTASYKLHKAINVVKVTLTEFGAKALPIIVNIIEKHMIPALKALTDKFEKDILPVLRDKVIPWLQDFGQTIIDTGREIGDFLLPALDTLSDLWKNVLQPALEAILPALEAILPYLEKVWDFLSKHKEIIIGVAAVIILLLNPWLAVAAAIAVVLAKWDEISAFFIGIGKDIKKFVDGVIKKVSDFPVIGEIIKDTVRMAKIYVETMLAVIKALFQAALDTIINAFKFWKAIFSGDWKGAWNALKDEAKVIWDLLSSLFGIALDAVKKVLSSKLQMVKGIGEDLGRLIVDAAKKVWEDLKRQFGDAVDDIATWLAGAAGTVAAIGTSLGNLILDEAKGRWNLLKERFSSAVNAVATWLSSAAGAVIAIGTSLGNLIVDEAKGRWDLLKERFSNAVNAVATWLAGAADAVKAIGTSLGNQILAGAGAVFGTLATAFSTAVDTIGTWIATNAQKIFDFGASVGDALIGGIRFVLDLDKLLWDLVAAGWTWFGNFSQHLFDLGATVGKAIWDGIKSAIGSIGSLIPGLSSIPGVSDALGSMGIGLQHGGIIPAGVTMPAILHGPEAVIPLGRGRGGAVGSGGITINLYVEGSLMGNEVEAEAFARDIGDRVRRQWRGVHV